MNSSTAVPATMRLRTRLLGFAVAVIVALGGGVLTSGAAPAAAAGALSCTGTSIYGQVPGTSDVAEPEQLISLDGSSVGSAELSGAIESTSTTLPVNPNGLGVSPGGLSAYSASDTATVINRYDAAAATWSAFPALPAPGAGITVGAVDPTSGIYYFGNLGSATSDAHIYGFDTSTDQLISASPLISFPYNAGQGSGDIAFDGSGNLYVVTSSSTAGTLEALAGPLPHDAAEAADLAPITLSTFAVLGAPVSGIAFDGTGTLYLGASNGVFSIDPGTGTARGALTPLPAALAGPAGRGLVDLASCAFPPTVSAQKNVVSRVNPTDQFTLQVTGPTVSFPAAATTIGSATGLQQTAAGRVLQAGPALARFGDTYTATEVAAGTTDLAQYVSTYSCIDAVNPANPEFPLTGTGTSVSFALDPVTGEAPSVVCTFTNAARAPALSLTKTADPSTYTAPGQTIDYTYTVTNSGNTTLSSIDVSETAFTGTGTPPVPTCATTTLAPAATAQCTAAYTVTAADVAAGSISNTAVADGQDTLAGAIASSPATAVVTVGPLPALVLTASVDQAGSSRPGDTVTYSFVIENTGNVPITAVMVDQTGFGGSGAAPVVDCPVSAALLAPGESVTCTAPYTLTQADVDAGTVADSAVATGADPTGATITSPSSAATVTIAAKPGVDLKKRAAPTLITAVGQTIDYSFVVTNTGNVTLTAVQIDEQSFSGSGGPLSVSCPAQTTIGSGADVTCTAAYRVTAADLASSSISNTAEAVALDPAGGTVRSAASRAEVEIVPPGEPAPAAPPAADGAPLARTGSELAVWLVPLAFLLALAGTGIVVMRARRRREQRTPD